MNNKPHSIQARKKMSNSHKRIGSKPPSQKGKHWNLSRESKEKIRLARLGKKHSKETREKLSQIGKTKKGKFASNWRGGITSKNHRLRTSIEMTLWRKSVLERDNFTCQKYGTFGGKLCAHHINNFSEFPEFRTAIDNGITLSEKAHREFHRIYGIKNNTREQLIEFVKKS